MSASRALAAPATSRMELIAADIEDSSAFRTPELQETRGRYAPGEERRGEATRSMDAMLANEVDDGNEVTGERDLSGARDFAQSHFRRRNRLETRLEELQRDVAKLTTKLRSGSNRTTSELTTPSGRINRAQSNSVRTLRELHNVTTERDQLRFELEKTQRSLALIEKKYHDAKRVKQAYEKLKAHCDSLQDSLELSEKIRVRQKKLLQQLQRQLEEQQTQKIDSARKLSKRGHSRDVNTSTTPQGRGRGREPPVGRSTTIEAVPDADFDDRIPRQAREDYDILDSLVSPASMMHRSNRDNHQARGEQAASESTSVRTRPRNKSTPVSTAPFNPYRSEFDKLLRTERPLQSRYTVQRPRQISTQQKQQEKSGPRREPASARSTVTQMTANMQQRARRKSPANRPKNHFLAPTQASLNRMQQVAGRDVHQRRPFIP